VAFNEPGHQREARPVDCLSRLLRANLADPASDCRDAIAVNENLAQKTVVRRTVPDLHIPEKNGRHPLFLPS
jgi:hypothetical protein